MLRTTAACIVGAVAIAALTTSYQKQGPRSFNDFMEDRIARDGALARCSRDPVAAAHDVECMNARRAAEAIAVREEQARRERLARESERKLEALRAQAAREQQAALEAEAAAAAAAQAEYEAQWVDPEAPRPDALDVSVEALGDPAGAPQVDLAAVPHSRGAAELPAAQQ